MNFDYTNSSAHTEYGYNLLHKFRVLSDCSEVIRHHHNRWLGPNKSGLIKDAIPNPSQIIYLADRVEVLIQEPKYILHQSERIINIISKFSGMWFNPRLVFALQSIGRSDAFWLDLTSEFLDKMTEKYSPPDERNLTLNETIELASLFAQVVDYKSHYTKSHCVTVTEVTLKLGTALGWAESRLKQLWIAALLHDLGKLAVPDEILEKPTALTAEEYAMIKKHPYYTYQLLESIPGFEEIARWASFHHQEINQGGYPFILKSNEVPEGARIIAIADRFTALTEDRPYRRKLSPQQALNILEGNVKQGFLDGKILSVLKNIVP